MRIRVKSDRRLVSISIPTWMICNRLTALLASNAMQKYAPEQLQGISQEKLTALFAQLRRIKSKHGHWELVDVCSADGETVKIIL